MSRFAKAQRVFFLEEPIFEQTEPHLRTVICPDTGVQVSTPVLPLGTTPEQTAPQLRRLLKSMIQSDNISNFVLWYYTPMARSFTSRLRPLATVYDCMDELSAFAGAPPEMRRNELALFQEADLVFTGGASLYESKRRQHPSVHLFPSSVDVAHFSRARVIHKEPEDQARIPFPRFGYAGVIDERMDIDLLRDVAAARPAWQFVLLGPVVKIDPARLPRANNIHYLGLKAYSDLPAYFSGWLAGILPFALNESTRFISPTKTPEYLAAALRVISTPIRDVVNPYGELGLVEIASDASEFIRVADSLIASPLSREMLLKMDRFLSKSSWDKTWNSMNALIKKAMDLKRLSNTRPKLVARALAEGMAHV
jgi:UDP-galactopyranose mutase